MMEDREIKAITLVHERNMNINSAKRNGTLLVLDDLLVQGFLRIEDKKPNKYFRLSPEGKVIYDNFVKMMGD